MIIVLQHSQGPLDGLPVAGIEMARKLEQRTPDQLITLITGLITDKVDQARYTFETWADLVAAGQRLLVISMTRPVLPAEVQLAAAWKESALTYSGDYPIILRELSKTWANCGATTGNVLSRLRGNYGATVSRVEARYFEGGQSAGLTAKLREVPASAAEVYIFDCDLQGIHNFLIEAHSDGRRYLVNGYQGGYSAVWWVCDSVYDPVDDRTDRRDVAELRPAYGNGQDIAALYDNFTDMLARTVQSGFGDLIGQRPVWRLLPFRPTDEAPLKFNNLPFMQVALFKIRNAQAVTNTIGGPARSLCVQAVLSLPITAPVVNPGEVLLAIAKLGLQASHSTDNKGTNKFKVDNDPTGQHVVLKGKLITRVGLKEIERLSQADIPPSGQSIDVGYSAAGVEAVITRTVP
jgi:hypothetical protein